MWQYGPVRDLRKVVQHSMELQERCVRLQKKAKLAREHGMAAVKHAEEVKAELKLRRAKHAKNR